MCLHVCLLFLSCLFYELTFSSSSSFFSQSYRLEVFQWKAVIHGPGVGLVRMHWCPGFVSCLWNSSSAGIPLRQSPQTEWEMWRDDKELPPEKEKIQTIKHVSSFTSHTTGSKTYAQITKIEVIYSSEK